MRMREKKKKTIDNRIIYRDHKASSGSDRGLGFRRHRGFTLVELIVVLVVLAIVAAMVIPALLGFVDSGREKGYKAAARKALAATQTALSDIYNDAGNQLHPDKRAKIRELAGSKVGDGTEFTVWTESVLWDGYTPATFENIGAYTVSKALYKAGDGMYFFYNGKDWKKYTSEADAKADISAEDEKKVIYIWPYKQDFAYIGEEGNGQSVQDDDEEIVTKLVTLNLDPVNIGHVYFVREGTTGKAGIKSVEVVFWKKKNKTTGEIETGYNWVRDPVDYTDRFTTRNNKIYKLFFEKGYTFIGWFKGERSEDLENIDWVYRNTTEETVQPYEGLSWIATEVFERNNTSFTMYISLPEGYSSEVVVDKTKFGPLFNPNGGEIYTIEKAGTEYATKDELFAYLTGRGFSESQIIRTDVPEFSSSNDAMMFSWKDGNRICWWSNAARVCLPSDCSDFFNGKTALKEFDFTQFNTDKVENMSNMFAGSTNLETVVFGESFGVKNDVTTLKNMFSGCEKLTAVDMDAFHSPDGLLTDVEGMFNGCKSLTAISFSEDFNTSNVTSMKEMFKGCAGAGTIDVSGFDTGKVTDVSFMFSGCKAVTGLDFSGENWSFAGVTTMESTFEGCESLVLDLSNVTTSNKLTTLKNTFKDCKSLGAVVLDHWDVSNVTDMTGTFMNCSGMSYADLSDWNVLKAADMSGLFSGCTSLYSVDISGWDMKNIVELDHAFEGDSSLEIIVLPENAVLSACTTLNSAFKNCSMLDMDFAGVTTAVLSDVGYIFNGCENLTTLDLEKWTVNITSGDGIIGAFAGCSNLERIYAKDTFTVSSACFNVDAFGGNEKLIAGYGRTTEYNTKWSADDNSAKRAWLDGTVDASHADAKGYFTDRDNVISYAQIIVMSNEKNNNWLGTGTGNFDIHTAGRGSVTGFTRYTGKSTVSELKAYLDSNGYKYKVATDTDFAPAEADSPNDTRYYNRNNMVDGNAQPYQVYFWAEGNDIYWWSDATYVFINPDSKQIFNDWQNITQIDLQGLDFSRQKNFAGEFKKCVKLERIIDGATGNDYAVDTSSAEGGADGQNTYVGMNMMFEDCRSLQSLDLSRFNTENVESMRAMFCRAGAEGFTVDFSNFDTSKVVTMAFMFHHGDQGNILPQSVGMKKLDLSSFSSESLMNVRGMFERNSTLEELSFGKGFTCESIKTEKVGSEVRGITNMFMDCTGLTSLDISMIKGGENITSIENMFNGCTNLEVLDMSGFIGDKVTTKTSLFASCNNLVSLDMRSFDGGLLTSFKEFLANKKKLQTVRLDSLNSASLTEVNNMFSGCNALTSVTFGDKFTCESVENMSQMFLACSSLTTLDLSMINTSAASNMSGMFNGCTSLTGITFGDGFTCSAAKNMSQMFNNCSSLKKLDLSRFDSENVTNLSFLLNGCSSLTEVKFGKSFTCEAVTNMQSMFKSCSSLQSLDLYEFNPVSLQNTQEMFRDCSSLKEIIVMDPDINGGRGFYKNTLSGYNRTNMNNSGNMFTGCTVLVGGFEPYITEFTSSKVNYDYARVSKVYSGVHQKGYFTSGRAVLKVMNADWLSIELGANKTNMTGFERNTTLTKDEVLAMVDAGTAKDLKDETLSKISIYFWVENNIVKWWSEADTIYTNQNSSSMFKKWDKLAFVDLQGVDFSLQKDLSHCFEDCTKLTAIKDGNVNYAMNTASATNMAFMFDDCQVLSEIDLSKFDTSKVTSMENMFARCAIKNADLSSFSSEELVLCTSLFKEAGTKGGLETVTFSTRFTCEKVTDMRWIFYKCGKLKELDVSMFSSNSLEKAQSMFCECGELEKLKLGKNFKCEKVTLMDTMFQNCKKLTELDLWMFNPKSSGLTTKSMFNGCSKLKTIYVSDPDDNDGYGFYFGMRGRNITDGNSGSMFNGCGVLVGGYEPYTTDYTASETNGVNYARVSKAGQPGYFTARAVTKHSQLRPMGSSWITTNSVISNKDSITGFIRNTTITSPDQLEGKNAKKLSDDSYVDEITGENYPVYFWNENGVINWWSEADIVYINPDTTEMFKEWKYATTLDLQGLNFSQVKSLIRCFYHCDRLTKIYDGSIGSDTDYAMETSAATNMQYMYDYCLALESIDLSRFDTSNVTNMENIFTRCKKLTSLDLSSFDSNSLQSAPSLFKGCESLTEVTFGSKFTCEKVTDMHQMFNNCKALQTVDISVFNTQRLENTEQMFVNCNRLKTIYVAYVINQDGTVKGFVTDLITSSNDMFNGDTALEGGANTGYDYNYRDKTYARIDDPDGGKPGYFTDKN